jgi:hypothetical protein
MFVNLMLSRRLHSWWCPSVNSFKFQPCAACVQRRVSSSPPPSSPQSRYRSGSSRQATLSRWARLYLKPRCYSGTHQHLVCELHSCLPNGRVRAWLRIAHCDISQVFTVPLRLTRPLTMFPCQVSTESFRVSPQFDGVALSTLCERTSPFLRDFLRPQ